MNKNCLNCKRYLHCKDPHKSVVFICDSYRKYSDSPMSNLLIQAQHQGEDTNFDFDVYDPENFELGDQTQSDNKIYDAFKKIISENRLVPPDLKIPEGDFEKAPNFYTWCVGDRFGNAKPFIEQAITGTSLFADWCPKCSDKEWFYHTHNVNDSLAVFERKVCLLEHGKCPSCGTTRKKLFDKKRLNPYTEAAIVWGQRSGKNQFLGMAASYHTHRIMKLENPIMAYNALKSVTLMMTFVALTAGQSKDTSWDPYTTYIHESPWFTAYNAMLTEQERRYGEGSLFKVKDTFIAYKHRRFLAHYCGPDERVLRGKTRIWGTIDELGLFPVGQAAEGKVKVNGPETYKAIKRSITTLRLAALARLEQGFYDIPFAYFVNISSPRSVRDMIMTRYRASLASRQVLGSKKATWEVNPHVPRKALKEEFRTDPVGSERDYGANPPLTSSPFISNPEIIEQTFAKKTTRIVIQHKFKTNKRGGREMWGRLVEGPSSKRSSCMFLDAGHVYNSFAFAIGHRNSKNGYPVIRAVGELIPKEGVKINFSLIFKELIIPLAIQNNVVYMGADRWQSIKMLDDAEEEYGIGKIIHSLKYQEMINFRDLAAENRLTLPLPEMPTDKILTYDHSDYPKCFEGKPASHLYLQFCTVQDTGSGVIKGDDLTDDLARATMGCHSILSNPAYEELNKTVVEDEPAAKRLEDMIVVRRGSGGSSGGSNSMGDRQNLGVVRSLRR